MMSDTGNVAKSLRERLGGNAEDRLGKAISELLENPLLTGAIGRAFDAREKAAQAQEVAMGALNLPSAADIERLTRRLRAVSHRLEGIEDGVDRLDRALTPSGVEARLAAIETQLAQLSEKLDGALRRAPGAPSAPRSTGGGGAGQSRGSRARAGSRTAQADKQVRAAKAARVAKDAGDDAKAPRAAKATRSARTAGSAGGRSRANRPAAGKA
jgi:hypothetical protein